MHLVATRLIAAVAFSCVCMVVSAQEWEPIPGTARDVAVGSNGTVWVIGATAQAGGFAIYRRDGSAWTLIPGGAVRVAVGADGNAWVVNNTNNIFRFNGQAWEGKSGAATDIGVGADNIPWIIIPDGGIARWNGSNAWTRVAGAATRIAVAPNGIAWVVNSTGNVFTWDGKAGWIARPGTARDIGASANGAIWATGVDDSIYRWDGTNWMKATGTASQVAVAPDGTPWVVNNTGSIFHARAAAQAGALVVGGTITMSGQAINVTQGTPLTPCSSGVAVSTSGSGTLVAGGGCNTAPQTPLVVTGLAPEFAPGALPVGTYICPQIAGNPQRLSKPCNGAFGVNTRDVTYGAASLVGPAKADSCPSGFRDDGDYCAKPESYGRGAGYPWVFGDEAFSSSGQWSRCRAGNSQGCEQPGGGINLVYPLCRAGFHAFGTNVCSPNCPGGWDDIGVSCRKPNTLASCTAYGRIAGRGYAFGDPRNGGECWTCPVLMHRTMNAVTSTDDTLPACTTGTDDGIMWKSAQFPEPGVAAFVVAPAIMSLAFADRAYVDAFLTRRAATTGTSKAALWQKMVDTPNDSAELKALLFGAILTAAQRDASLGTDAGRAAGLFQSYIGKRRTYIAQDARNMYEKYLDFNAYKQWQGAKSTMLAGGPLAFAGAGTGMVLVSPQAGLAGTVGVPPDDYVNAAYAGAVPDAPGLAFIKALTDLAGTPYANAAVTAVADPTAVASLGTLSLSALSSAKAIHDALEGAKVISGISALGSRGGMGVDLGMSLGGTVLDGIAGIMSVYSQLGAAEQYSKLVSEAAKPVNLRGILSSGTNEDKNSLIMWWALATSAYKSSGSARQAPVSNADLCSAYAQQCIWIKQAVTAARL